MLGALTKVLPPLLAVLVAAGCGDSSIPTEPESRAFLQQLIQAAQASDVERLCEVADCQPDDRVQPLDAPVAPPKVIGTSVLNGSSSGAQPTIGGRILDLCGVDTDGNPYRSQILVFRADGRLRTLSFRYWQSMGVAGAEPPVTAPGPPAAASCD
jgi:hypothetical protein